MKDTFLLIVGTVVGSLSRFFLLEFFSKLYKRDYLGTICVNSFATFILAIIASSYGKFSMHSSYILFLSVGFIGSFSTFSTFMIDVFKRLQKRKISEGFLIIILSIIFSLLCGFIGYWIMTL